MLNSSAVFSLAVAFCLKQAASVDHVSTPKCCHWGPGAEVCDADVFWLPIDEEKGERSFLVSPLLQKGGGANVSGRECQEIFKMEPGLIS